MSTLGNRIIKERKAKGLSQEKLAEDANINLRTLQRIEKGTNTPHGETLKRISQALDIPIKELIACKPKPAVNKILVAIIIILLLILAFILFLFLKTPGSENKLITKRIQYDVSIVNNEPYHYWWLENIEESERFDLINNLLEKALSGEVKTCDAVFNPVGPEKLQLILTKWFPSTVQRGGTNETFDTILSNPVDSYDIECLRFQEEWSYDEDNLIMDKRILGICLIRYEYIQEAKAKMPLFWIIFDEVLLDNEMAKQFSQ